MHAQLEDAQRRVRIARHNYDVAVDHAERELARVKSAYQRAVEVAEGNLRVREASRYQVLARFQQLALYTDRVESTRVYEAPHADDKMPPAISLVEGAHAYVTTVLDVDTGTTMLEVVVGTAAQEELRALAPMELEEQACTFADLVASQAAIAREEEARRQAEIERLSEILRDARANTQALARAEAAVSSAYANTAELDAATGLLESLPPEMSKSEVEVMYEQEMRERTSVIVIFCFICLMLIVTTAVALLS
jgi:hypothetical protein